MDALNNLEFGGGRGVLGGVFYLYVSCLSTTRL